MKTKVYAVLKSPSLPTNASPSEIELIDIVGSYSQGIKLLRDTYPDLAIIGDVIISANLNGTHLLFLKEFEVDIDILDNVKLASGSQDKHSIDTDSVIMTGFTDDSIPIVYLEQNDLCGNNPLQGVILLSIRPFDGLICVENPTTRNVCWLKIRNDMEDDIFDKCCMKFSNLTKNHCGRESSYNMEYNSSGERLLPYGGSVSRCFHDGSIYIRYPSGINESLLVSSDVIDYYDKTFTRQSIDYVGISEINPSNSTISLNGSIKKNGLFVAVDEFRDMICVLYLDTYLVEWIPIDPRTLLLIRNKIIPNLQISKMIADFQPNICCRDRVGRIIAIDKTKNKIGVSYGDDNVEFIKTNDIVVSTVSHQYRSYSKR